MNQPLNKAAVIGAGVMGANIAAHIANAGISVYLLDIVPEGSENRNAIAESAIDQRLQSPSPALTHPDHAKRIIPGNVEDHLPSLNQVDWIIEAIVERLDIKQALYKKIDAVRNPGCVVSSNTSTIPLRELIRGMPKSFSRNFLITHFFNPPRYMRLMEIISGPSTCPAIVQTVSNFIDRRLGKSIVECKDTPGFICNRIGVFWLQCALHEAIRLNLTIEEVDAALSRPVGIPRTGTFGLIDLIGLDLMPHIIDSLKMGLEDHDDFHAVSAVPNVFNNLLRHGYLGRKAKSGFYRIRRAAGKKTSESIDLATGEYRPTKDYTPQLPDRPEAGSIRTLLDLDNKIGRFAWHVVSETLNYSAGLVPEIATNLTDIDRAIRLGFNWKFGPFEMIDLIGIDYLARRIHHDGKQLNGLLSVKGSMYRTDRGRLQYKNPKGQFKPVPPLPGVLSLNDIKRAGKPLLEAPCANLWDIGDGVVCFEFRTPMNTLNEELLDLLYQSIDLATDKFKAMVIYNDSPHFSVGANLKNLLAIIKAENWDEIKAIIQTGQKVYQALKYSSIPVVGAAFGLALGGGAEILLHCDAIQAHIELNMGLVETGVGLIPGWGGCKEMLLRYDAAEKPTPHHPIPAAKAFSVIAKRSISPSAELAREMKFLRSDDQITMNRDRLLADAKSKALHLGKHYKVAKQAVFWIDTSPIDTWLPTAIKELESDHPVSEVDRNIFQKLAAVLAADPLGELVTEQTLLDRELEAFLFLIRQPKTKERIQHMLKTGKPLRN